MIYTIRYPQDAGLKFEMFRYPGGEVQVRFTDSQMDAVVTADRIHVVATIKDGEIMGLAQLTNAITNISLADKTLIMPYLPYARADRAFTKGDCRGLEAFADQINTMCYERVVTLDAHSEIATDAFWGMLINVSPIPIITTVFEQLEPGVSVLLPDEGAAKRYGDLWLCASKKRDPISGKLLGFEVPPKEIFAGASSILIVDDICDGGGTFIGIAEQLADYGLPLYLYVTHGIFSKGLRELRRFFSHIYTTDSLAVAEEMTFPNLVTVLPCMGVILDDILERSELWENAAKAEVE